MQGRTPLFRKLVQATRQANWLNHNPQHQALFFEAKEASRVSRRDFVRMLGAAGHRLALPPGGTGSSAAACLAGSAAGRVRQAVLP